MAHLHLLLDHFASTPRTTNAVASNLRASCCLTATPEIAALPQHGMLHVVAAESADCGIAIGRRQLPSKQKSRA